jgi:formylglycine-generating enzyme required for sulfatase activity/dienelactone hydrolase
MSFWGEMKRRKVFQVGVAYAVIAWLVIQVANNFFPPLGLPAWTLTLVAVLILVGFPFALLLAWAYEVTPEGVRLTRSVSDDSRPAAKPAVASYVVTAVLAGALGAGAFWFLSRDVGSEWFENEGIPQIERYIAAGDWEAAFAAAREAEVRVGNRIELEELWPRLSWRVTIPSDPPGATVFRRAYDAPESSWEKVGVTPLENIRIPFGLSRLRFELDGYLPLHRAIGGGALMTELQPAAEAQNQIWLIGTETFKLDTAETLPEGKVRVPAWNQQIDGVAVAFSDFFLDRTEVTNAAYKAFVDAGGYQQPNLWPPVVRDGAVVPWEQAMGLFTDATGRPGPSTWQAGDYPEGEDLFPVSGVSWYEAAAYAEFMGQELPTIHHWRRALAGAMYQWELPASNFDGEQVLAVGESGAMSYVGAYDLAGNVREWSLTARDHQQVILGGSWNDARYTPMNPESYRAQPLDRSPSNGFRLVITRDDPAVTARARAPLAPVSQAVREPVSDEVFAAYAGMYAYERVPLNAVSEAREETRIWTRERITFDAAYEAERVVLYLYLPRNGVPPYQTVIYWPGGDAGTTRNFDDHPVHLDYVLKSGRAVAFPIFDGTFERGQAVFDPNRSTLSRRDALIHNVKDLRRSLDYLETRADIDREALAYYGYSWGASAGIVSLAHEPRIGVAVLYVGFVPDPGRSPYKEHPEVDPVNALPRVHVPVLLLNGEFDTAIPPGGDQRVLELLGTPQVDQRHVIAPSGHFVPRETLIRETLDWLDTYLGVPRSSTSFSSLGQ